jgi:hypothetical protein
MHPVRDAEARGDAAQPAPVGTVAVDLQLELRNLGTQQRDRADRRVQAVALLDGAG